VKPNTQDGNGAYQVLLNTKPVSQIAAQKTLKYGAITDASRFPSYQLTGSQLKEEALMIEIHAVTEKIAVMKTQMEAKEEDSEDTDQDTTDTTHLTDQFMIVMTVIITKQQHSQEEVHLS
jgi:hypothetical protein